LFNGGTSEFSPSFNTGAIRLDFRKQFGILTPNNNQINIINTIFSSKNSVIAINQDETSDATIKTNTNIHNCTFFNNGNAVLKKTDFISSNPDSYNKVNITNSIFWQDQSIEALLIDNNSANVRPKLGYL